MHAGLEPLGGPPPGQEPLSSPLPAQEDLCPSWPELDADENDYLFREEERRWRAEDLEQRALDNARQLWARFVEKNRRDVEERAEQLKGISNLAALVAGFVMISYLQFGFDIEGQNPRVLISFGFTTAVVVALSFSSMVMCGLIHASILKMGRAFVTEEEEAEFIHRCREFALRYKPGDRPPQPLRTFQNTWRARCEGEWQRAFYMFSFSIPWMLANLALASFIKFQGSTKTAIAVTVIMGIAGLYFFLSHFRWMRYVTGTRSDPQTRTLKETEGPMGLPFDWHQRPARVTRLNSGAHGSGVQSRGQAVAAILRPSMHLLRRHGLMQERQSSDVDEGDTRLGGVKEHEESEWEDSPHDGPASPTGRSSFWRNSVP